MVDKLEEQWNLVGYARVSTDDQDLSMQVAALMRHGVPDKQIFEEHISAKTMKRPAFEKMMQNLRPGDVLVVWKLDRLSRSLKDLVTFAEELGARKIEIRSLTEAIDTTTPTGRLMFQMMGVLAEFERSLTSERTIAGIANAKERNTWRSRPPVMTAHFWNEALERLKEEPSLSANKLFVMAGEKFVGKVPSKATYYKYMDLLRDGAEYPFPEWAEDQKEPKERAA